MKSNISKTQVALVLAAMALASPAIAAPTIFNDTVFVQPAGAGAPVVNSSNAGAGVNPALASGLVAPVTTTPVITIVGDRTTTTTGVSGGGIEAEINGDLTLSPVSTSTTQVRYVRAVQNNVYNADQGANAGLSESTKPIGGYFDGNGAFVYLGDLDGAGDFLVPLTPAQLALPGVTTVDTTTPTGANLTVAGMSSLNGINNNGGRIRNVANGIFSTDGASLGQLESEASIRAAADNDLIIADNNLTTNLNNETTARVLADNTLTTDLNNEITARTTADNTLTTNLNNEITTRSALIRREADGIHIGTNSLIIDDTTLGNAGENVILSATKEGPPGVATGISIVAPGGNSVTVGGTGIVLSGRPTVTGGVLAVLATPANAVALNVDITNEAGLRTAGDVALQTELNTTQTGAGLNANGTYTAPLGTSFLGASTSLSNASVRLDTALTNTNARVATLENQVNESARNIKTLRRGVAMAAALQTPVINSGDTSAVKIGAATYDGEGGLAIGYSRRINASVTVNAELATGFPDLIARGGVNYSF